MNNSSLQRAQCTPFSLSPVGGLLAGAYATEGLVLWLDSRRPRRGGSLPGMSAVWEDLSGNGYDVALSAQAMMNGGAYLDITNIYGVSEMPLNENYVVEVVTCPSYLNLMWIYSTHPASGYPQHSGGALGITQNDLTRGKQNPFYKFTGLSNYATLGCIASFYVGAQKNQLYINGMRYNTQTSPSSNVFGLTDANPLLNARAEMSNADSPTYISALRIYNRELSEAERLHHWELDKKRFNIQLV